MKVEIELSLHRPSGFRLEAALTIDSAGFTGLLGPSGCGKTTFLRCVAGLEPAVRGRIVCGDDVWLDSQTRRSVPTHRRALGYVFQEAALFSHLSVRRNILYGYDRTPASARRLSLDDVCELTGCTALLDRDVATLSGGERQRVAIARALLPGPSLLLMDEPLASLDTASRRQILPLLKRLHRELAIPVLYVTHNVSELALLADRVALFDAGRIVAQGDVFTMLAQSDLVRQQEVSTLSVIEARVEGYDQKHQLARLAWDGGEILLPVESAPVPDKVRVIIHANDISLIAERPEHTSILNIFPVTVTETIPESGPHTLVRLDARGAVLLARVTRYSAERLSLHPGQELYAQVKSAALGE